MDRKGWTLLAVSFAGETGLSPVQLQKCIFLLGKEQKEKVGSDFYEFSAYNYGPFSKLLYQDAEALNSEGLVLIERPAGSYATYRITPKGAARARQMESEAPSPTVAYLKVVVEWAQQLSFSDLLRAIYSRYPEYRSNSVFQF
jgi:uncharacterized protein YwgA